MAEPGAARDDASRVLGLSPATLIVALIVLRVLVAAVLIAHARSHPVRDEGLLRYERVAASPATPYRNFGVEWMPVQTAVVELLGGEGASATATRVALVALAADLAVAAALGYGWGRRTAAIYLIAGSPVVVVGYARLDLIAVAFAAWALALLRRLRDGPAGAVLGLAILSGLWVLVLAPVALVRRSRGLAVGGAAVLLAGGAAWYVVGGPKGPIQVLSYRGAVGWDVQSSVGGFLWLLRGDPVQAEAGVLRTGFASTAVRATVLLAIAFVVALSWRRANRGREVAGGPALASASVLLLFSPTFLPAWAAWLVPWTAVGIDTDRAVAIPAAAAIGLTGLIAAAATSDTDPALIAAKLLVLSRTALLALTVGRWLLQTGRSSP